MSDAWRSRIVGTGTEDPTQLVANPRNWRIHPEGQQDALGSVLDEVGWVGQVLVNRTTGHVVDGHLRVELALARVERAVENSSAPGALVLDPFMGSGSALIACERSGRLGVGIELEPHYCDVIVARWEAFSGSITEKADG
jgi:hypothetical protein